MEECACMVTITSVFDSHIVAHDCDDGGGLTVILSKVDLRKWQQMDQRVVCRRLITPRWIAHSSNNSFGSLHCPYIWYFFSANPIPTGVSNYDNDNSGRGISGMYSLESPLASLFSGCPIRQLSKTTLKVSKQDQTAWFIDRKRSSWASIANLIYTTSLSERRLNMQAISIRHQKLDETHLITYLVGEICVLDLKIIITVHGGLANLKARKRSFCSVSMT